jgi:hypothetical protein
VRYWLIGLLVTIVAAGGAGATKGSVQGISTDGVVVPLGTEFRGECVLEGERIEGRLAYWELNGVIPAFRKGGKGVVLAPQAEQLPRLANSPTEPFKGEYVVDPRLMASPLDNNCVVRSFDPLKAITLEQPGPHVFVQYDQRVSFVHVPSDQAPIPQPCALNDPDFSQASSDIPPPPDTGDDLIWAVAAFCNTTKVVGLYVESTARCPKKADTSSWPGMPYINQYDAGAYLKLPKRFGYRGGNACGPSSLLMAMLQSAGARDLPKLTRVFDATMQRPRAAVRDEQQNGFTGAAKAVPFLKSLGWKKARGVKLGDNVEQIEERILTSLKTGPVVISTAFGNSTWGNTGGGHIIAIVGADQRGNFIVMDPAGNFFVSHKGGYYARGGHYGPGSCGYRAVYPMFWVLAYTTGRDLIELGPRTRTRRSPRVTSSLARSPATGSAAPTYGSAIAIYDAHPGNADAPRSFYLKDPSGRRAGWIDGRIVAEIPNSAVSQDAPGWTETALGDESIAPWPDKEPAMPRALVVPNPAPGTRLYVSGTKSARFALTAEAWRDGAVIAKNALAGKGTGAPTRVAVRALTALP